MAAYDDTNRAFLQALISRGSITFKQAQPILASILTASGNEVSAAEITHEDLDNYIAAASEAVSAFDFEIRSSAHQTTKERYYALVNGTSDPLTQIATVRTPDEMSFIGRVLDAMFETYNTRRCEVMAVTSMQAIKLARPPLNRRSSGVPESADKGLTSSQAEKLMASLVDEGWMERSAKGYYTLSPRALMELRGWLVASYNEEPDEEDGDEDEWQRIKNCVACKNIITVGERCEDWRCNVRLHTICAAPFWRGKGEKKCPGCKKKWGNGVVGEKAAMQKQNEGAGGSSRRHRGSMDGADEEEVEEAEAESDD